MADEDYPVRLPLAALMRWLDESGRVKPGLTRDIDAVILDVSAETLIESGEQHGFTARIGEQSSEYRNQAESCGQAATGRRVARSRRRGRRLPPGQPSAEAGAARGRTGNSGARKGAPHSQRALSSETETDSGEFSSEPRPSGDRGSEAPPPIPPRPREWRATVASPGRRCGPRSRGFRSEGAAPAG